MAVVRIVNGAFRRFFAQSCFQKTDTKRGVHAVTTQELTQYRESLKQFIPRSYPFQNIALCKQRGKDQPVILTDGWPNFSCTAVFQSWTNTLCFPTRNQRTSWLMLLSSCEEKFAIFLNDSKLLQEGAMIVAIDSITNGHLDVVAKTMFSRWQETPQYPFKSYYFAGKTEDIPLRLNSDEFFVDKLTLEHVDFISEHWSFINSDVPIIKKYFKRILTLYDISAGIFTTSDPSYPVSWTMYSDLGHIIALYTLPQYRRKGFPLVVAANVYDQLLQKGIIPFGEQFKESPIADEYGKYVLDSTWRDSITGEHY